MQQATPTRAHNTTWIGSLYEDKQRRRLFLAIVLLLAAITAVLMRDYKSSVANEDDAAVTEQAYAPMVKPALPVPAPAAEASLPVATPAASAKSAHAHKTHSGAKAASKPSTTWGPATTAAQRASTSDQTQAQAHERSASYPLLTQAMAVQGSVLLQAMIGIDGAVQEMRVISGPTILVSAARQAVQQWRFKPYLVNGNPVETYARVTVNFTIDVSNTEARYHVNSVSTAPAL
jgi:TonB family protein